MFYYDLSNRSGMKHVIFAEIRFLPVYSTYHDVQ